MPNCPCLKPLTDWRMAPLQVPHHLSGLRDRVTSVNHALPKFIVQLSHLPATWEAKLYHLSKPLPLSLWEEINLEQDDTKVSPYKHGVRFMGVSKKMRQWAQPLVSVLAPLVVWGPKGVYQSLGRSSRRGCHSSLSVVHQHRAHPCRPYTHLLPNPGPPWHDKNSRAQSKARFRMTDSYTLGQA